MGGQPLGTRDQASPPGAVSGLLRAWGRGDLEARNAFLPLVYTELRRRAAGYLRHERHGHTLQPTALVHEVYLQLAGQTRVAWHDRAHFFRTASQMMRRILVDHARARAAAKRPDGALRVTLDGTLATVDPRGCDLLMLDRALSELAHLDLRQESIVELCYFGGLTEMEIAGALSVSRSTVARELRSAKAWLYRRMTSGHHEQST